jgi:Cytochrome c554 and c-prime
MLSLVRPARTLGRRGAAFAAVIATCALPASEARQTPQAQDVGHQHFSAKGCAGCHPQHYRQWRGSLHALAHFEPIYDAYFIKASQQSNKALEPFCGRCHTPIGVRTKQIPFARPLRKLGDTQVKPVAREGVQCDFCHTITGHTAVQNSGFVFSPSTIKRGPLADARPVSHQAKHDPAFRRAELCGTCHQVVHPTNNIPLETTYAEWKRSPYAKAGIVCQDCHMTAGLQAAASGPIGKPTRHPGQAATTGKQRPHVSRHFFVGPNLVFANRPEAAELKRLSEALLRRAGRVVIDELTRTPGKGLQLVIQVRNTGAGHYLPTGVTEIRQLWLEIKVTDARGRVLLHSGALDKKGNIKPGAVIYRTEVHDAAGRDTTLFWNTVKKASDRRIPPLGALLEYIPLPRAARGKLTVEAALHYRSVSPAGLAEAGLPPNTVTIPIFTIHRTKRTISAP